jgi:hypothetical protein
MRPQKAALPKRFLLDRSTADSSAKAANIAPASA